MQHINKLIFTSILLSASLNSIADIEYPEGYREWTHVKSMVIEPGHPLENPFQGIHHIYGNKKAMSGYKKGKFSNGSVIVFDLLNYKHSDKTIVEEDRKLIGVMKKDSKAKSTGGWLYQAFKADSKTDKIVSDGGKSCYSCHLSQKNSDFVFSSYRK